MTTRAPRFWKIVPVTANVLDMENATRILELASATSSGLAQRVPKEFVQEIAHQKLTEFASVEQESADVCLRGRAMRVKLRHV